MFVDTVLWVLWSAEHWHDLPERYGKWNTVHKRLTRRVEASIWKRVFDHLVDDPDNSYVSHDISLVRAHHSYAWEEGYAPIASELPNGLSQQRVLEERSYDADVLRTLPQGMTAEPVIPYNPTRKRLISSDVDANKVRTTVERCFNKLKHFRRIATRFDRQAIYFLSFIHLASAML